MENSPALVIMLMTVPALVAGVVTALNAKKTNAAWRVRRQARAAAKAASQ